MNIKFHALNVGRGDAFVLEIESENRSYVVLIDGGDKHPEIKISPLTFLNQSKWDQVDLLVLTHLHHDHVVGLLEVADNVKVTEAVMPYHPFDIEFQEVTVKKAKQSQEILQLYQQLLMKLKQQGTNIHFRPPFADKDQWNFDEIGLRHLFPQKNDRLYAYEIIEQLTNNHNLSADEQNDLLKQFDAMSNMDSSIWIVENKRLKEQWLLLGGDALLPAWEQLLQREDLRPHGLKVSHHGMKDGINEELLKQLSPDWILITNHHEEYLRFRSEWERLAISVGCELVITGDQLDTIRVSSQLPQIPVRVKK